MGIKQILTKIWTNEDKGQGNHTTNRPNQYVFTEEDRTRSLELRKLKHDIEVAKLKSQLAELQEDVEEDGLSAVMPVVANFLNTLNKGTAQQQNVQTITPDVVVSNKESHEMVTDEEIRQFLDTLPKYKLKLAKTMSKDKLYPMINEKFPLTRTDFERGYQILISEY